MILVKGSAVPKNLLSQLYDSVLNHIVVTELWNQYGSVATNNREFQVFFDSIIDKLCSDQYNEINANMIFECIHFISNFSIGIHSKNYNIQNNEIVFNEILSQIEWLSKRTVLNLSESSSLSCDYDGIYWPTSIHSLQSLIHFKTTNESPVPYNVDCFFMQLCNNP